MLSRFSSLTSRSQSLRNLNQKNFDPMKRFTHSFENKFRSNYVYKKTYTGPVRGVVLDWSGTTVDAYVIAPAVVFVDVFEKHKVPISMEEARLPMGLRKDLHIKAITEMPEIRQRWNKVYGRNPDQNDVENMFKDFVPMQLGCLKKYATLLPETVETVNILRSEFDVRIGHTTGFTKEMVTVLLEEAKKQGYEPDASVAGDEVLHGARPKPHMVYKNMDLLDINPVQAVVKVDDTVSGCNEGTEAGCWSVGIARWSNYMNVNSLEEAGKLTQEDVEYKLAKTREILEKSGAHYVINRLDELPGVIEEINERLARGESP